MTMALSSFRLLAAAVLVLSLPITGAAQTCTQQESFESWLPAMKRDAAAAGVSRGTIARVLDNVAYDPAIGPAFLAGGIQDVELWPVWDAVRCPVLVLRGAESDILPAATAAEMRERGPKAQLVEFPGIGHAPALMTESSIAVVRDWLSATA